MFNGIGVRLAPGMLVLALLLAACADGDPTSSTVTATSAAGAATATRPAVPTATQAAAVSPVIPTMTPAAMATPTAVATDEPTATPLPEPTATLEPEPTATGAPLEPVAILGGTFEEINYSGSGAVTIVRNPDGTHALRFGDFSTEGGPMLVVYLSATTELTDGGVLGVDYIDLGPLQSTEGDQQYAIPPEVDPGAWSSVVIWCAAFDTGFIGAILAPA